MKRLLTAILPLSFVLSAFAGPGTVTAPVDHMFIPKGFDNNDNVEVVVTGKFANTCYSRNKVEVKVNQDQIDVRVTALYNQDQRNCEKVEVLFLENVTIGSLQAGSYKINVNGTLKETIAVEESRSNSVDDHLYAQVDYVELGFTGGVNGDVFLVGRAPECLEFDKLEMLNNGKDTLSVLPIMKKVSEDCSGRRAQFTIPVHFEPNAFDFSQILLFVRTMDGKSVHALVEKL
jgi:hypothetical protein